MMRDFYPNREEFLSTSRSFSNRIGWNFQQNRDIIIAEINSLKINLTVFKSTTTIPYKINAPINRKNHTSKGQNMEILWAEQQD